MISSNNIKEAHEIAIERGGSCLSIECLTTKSKIDFKCFNGHIWSAPFSRIKAGTWCPMCPTKTQNKLQSIISDLYPNYTIHSNYLGFDWLINNMTGRKLEIDIFVSSPDKSFTLAIEYDGQGHFFPVKFGGCNNNDANKIFLNTVKRDDIKNELIKAHPDEIQHFIRIPYTYNISTSSIINKLKENNIKIGVN